MDFGIIVLALPAYILVIIVAFEPDDEIGDRVWKVLRLFMVIGFLTMSTWFSGREDGAYKQLRNQTKIEYRVDSDMNITDTIIKFK
jgi:hypothetical protein